MFDLHLTPEQLEMRDTVRDFVAREVKPLAVQLDQLEQFDRRFPMALLDKASAMGLRSLSLSEEMGGAGADRLTCCIVAEELAVGDVTIASAFAQTARLAREWFGRVMNAEQRERFLPEFLADPRFHLAWAHHEPGDACKTDWTYHAKQRTEPTLRTRAARAGNGDWILRGVKDNIRNGELAKIFAVDAVTEAGTSELRGVQTFLVPRDARGAVVSDQQKAPKASGPDGALKFGFYHGMRSELILEDCRVPAGNLVDSRASASDLRNPAGACEFLAIDVGIGRAAYEAAIEYSKLRVQGGYPIAQHEAIGVLLADCAIRLQAARNLVWQAAWASDHPDAILDGSVADLPLSAIADVFTSEAIHEITLAAAQVFGGSGVMRDLPMQKYVRDALVFLRSEKNNDVARFRIAEAVVGYQDRGAPAD